MKVTKWNGRPISSPGWYSDIPIERYHSPNICTGYSVSSTDLRLCWAKSPAHMHAQWAENPKREVKSETRAMILGRCAHHMLLGEEQWSIRFVKQPETYHDRKSAQEKVWHNGATYCKFWTESQLKAGRTPVTVAELETIVKIAETLRLQPLINDDLLRGLIETSGFFRDDQTGLWVKVRPDVIPHSGADFVDLKTAIDVTTPALQAAIRTRAYHQQGALIWEACDHLDQPFESFILMFAETASPYCARAVPLHEDDLSRGRKQNRVEMRRIAACINEDHWPGPGEDDLSAMPIAFDERARIDARLKREGL
jgi:hypothetical protein